LDALLTESKTPHGLRAASVNVSALVSITHHDARTIASLNILLCGRWLQAQGRQVMGAQLFDIDKLRQVNEDELQRMQLLASSLDLSAARILQLGLVQVPPQQGVLWLEQVGATEEWGQLCPGLVVLAAPCAQVRKADMCMHVLQPGWMGGVHRRDPVWMAVYTAASD
jgi:hypothetical protein